MTSTTPRGTEHASSALVHSSDETRTPQSGVLT